MIGLYRLLLRALLAEVGLLLMGVSALSGEALNEQGNMITRKKNTAAEALPAGTLQANFLTIATDDGGKSPTATAANLKKLKLTQSYSTGNIVVITNLNGKTVLGEAEGGLIVGVPYWVRAVSGTEVAFANTKAQAESATESEWIEFTVEVKATTVVKKIEEHTGAKTARKETKYKAAANLVNASEGTAPEVEASATVKVRWLLWWTAETSGTFMGLEAVTEKELATADLYKITSTTLSQNAYIL